MKKLFFLLCILAAGCNSTSIINSWKAPGAAYTPEEFKKVLVLALIDNADGRKEAEEQIASSNKALHPSYPLFAYQDFVKDSIKIKNMLLADGYDGAVVLRLITTRTKSTFVQGGVNPAYTQNYIFYYNDYYKSGGVATDEYYIVATNFYSLKQNKVLWTGVTESANPKKLNKLIKGVSKEVGYKMREDKFIPE